MRGKNLLIFSSFVTKKSWWKNSKLIFSEYIQNISRFKSFGKFIPIVNQFLKMLFGMTFTDFQICREKMAKFDYQIQVSNPESPCFKKKDIF